VDHVEEMIFVPSLLGGVQDCSQQALRSQLRLLHECTGLSAKLLKRIDGFSDEEGARGVNRGLPLVPESKVGSLPAFGLFLL